MNHQLWEIKQFLKDIEDCENEVERLSSRNTVIDYLDVLDRLHLIENQEAYGENYRSPSKQENHQKGTLQILRCHVHVLV